MEADTAGRERQAIIREKIAVDLRRGEPTTAELVWAKMVGENQYGNRNVPIWVYGLAYGDVVEADTREDGRRHFKKVLNKGGLLTVRAAGTSADREVFDGLCEMLQGHAVATERFSPRYVAFAMEPTAFAQVESAIDEAERSGRIYAEIANDDDSGFNQ